MSAAGGIGSREPDGLLARVGRVLARARRAGTPGRDPHGLHARRTDGAYRGPRAFRLPASRRQAEHDVAREIRFHLEACVADLEAAGWAPAAARAEAQRRFGDPDAIAAECAAIEGGRQAGLARRERAREVWQDVRRAAGGLARSRAFTLAAVGTLGLALGATAAMFSVVDAVLLRALPFAAPERAVLLNVYAGAERRGGSPALLDAWATASRELAAVAAERSVDATLQPVADGAGGAGALPGGVPSGAAAPDAASVSGPERLAGLAVSGRFAEVLGLRPVLGRAIGPADDVPGAPPVAMLGYGLWRTRFAADSAIVGRTVRLDGVARTVVGVLPAALDALPQAGAFWIPLALDPSQRTNFTPYLTLHGRLRAGATRQSAARELDAIAHRLGAPATVDGVPQTVRPVPLLRELTDEVRRPLLLLLAAVAAVLVIGCANVATLVLARSLGRTRELAVRAALGAGRGRLVRQLVVEHLLLGLLAAAVALPVAWVGVRALVAGAPPGVPRLAEAGLDARTLAFTVLVGLASALAAGAAAAWHHARVDVRGALQQALVAGGTRGATDRAGLRWRQALVGGEAAFALVLLVCTGLLLRSAAALGRVAPGYDAEGVITARLALPVRDYPALPRAVATFEAIVDGARQAPGVAAAALVSRVPLGGSRTSLDVAPDGAPFTSATRTNAALRLASPGYFQTMRVPLLAGRDLSDADRAGTTSVVVVNVALARRLAGGTSVAQVVGRTIRSDNSAFADSAGRPRAMTIVGVVGDVRDGGPREDVAPELYAPLGQVGEEPWNYWIGRELVLVARPAAPGPAPADARPDPTALVPALTRAVARVDPNVPLHDVRTTGERLAEALAVERFTTRLLVALGAAGLALAALGIHGVVALAARQRAREMAIRLAIGGSPRQALGLMLRQGMRPVGVGLLVGGLAAMAVARAAGGLLYGVPPLDGVSLGSAALVLAIVGLGACWRPARRVAAVPPAQALGAE